VELRCPNCGTRFRVDSELLRAKGSVVRCSLCNTRFRAFPDPSKPPEIIERGEPQSEPSPVPEPLTEEKFEADDDEEAAEGPGEPEPPVETFAHEEEEEAGDWDEPAGSDQEGETEAEAGAEAKESPRQRKKREKAERKAQKAQEKEQKKQAKAEAKAEKKQAKAAKRAAKGGWGRFFVKLLVGVLVLALLGELAYVFRVRLLSYAQPRALAERALDELQRRYPIDWQLPVAVTHYQVKGLSAQRVELPSGKQVTVLQGSLRNNATFDQRPPRIAVRALGAGDRVLYRRTLKPGRPFQAQAAGEQGETALDRAWRHAREEFPARFDPGRAQPFQLVLDGVPPGVRSFRLKMVN
jgi:predicted Zn finger-like uncharacterized protein